MGQKSFQPYFSMLGASMALSLHTLFQKHWAGTRMIPPGFGVGYRRKAF